MIYMGGDDYQEAAEYDMSSMYQDGLAFGSNKLCEPSGKIAKSAFKGVQAWLSQMKVEERQAVLTETCPEFVRLLLEVLRRHQDCAGGRSCISASLQPGSLSISVEQKGAATKDNAHESAMYRATRLFSSGTTVDSVSVSLKFVEDVDFLMETLGDMSSGHCFQTPGTPRQSHNKPSKLAPSEFSRSHHSSSGAVLYDNFPLWFRPNEGGTVYQWLGAFFEQTIFAKYCAHSRGRVLSRAEAFGDCRNLQEYWKELRQCEKIKIIEESKDKSAENSAGEASQPQINIAVKSISRPASEDVHSESAETSKQFLAYAAAYVAPYHFMDTVYFLRLELACKPIVECCGALLANIKKHYREKITETLMQEDDKQQHGKARPGVNDEAENEIDKDSEEDGSVDNYLSDYWDTFRDMEYYKFFFAQDGPSDSPVVSRQSAAEGKRRRKRKARKSRKSHPRLVDDDIHNVPPVRLDRGGIPPVVSSPILPPEREDVDNKPMGEATAEEGEGQKSEESEEETQTAKEPQEEVKAETPEVEEYEEEPKLSARNLERLAESVARINVPETQAEDGAKAEAKECDSAVATKSKKASRKQRVLMEDAKREYEELRAKAMAMFAASTTSLVKPKKAKKKKCTNATSTKNANISGRQTADKDTINTKSDNSVTPSTVGSFTPKRSQTPSKAGTELSRKLLMSPQSDTHCETQRESSGEGHIPGPKVRTRRIRRSDNRWVATIMGAAATQEVPQRRKTGGAWRGREVTYRRKECPQKSAAQAEDVEVVSTTAQSAEIVEKEKATEAPVASTVCAPQASSCFVYEPFYLEELKSERIFAKLNSEIASAMQELDAYNRKLYPVCDFVRGLIENEARKLFPHYGLVRAVLYGSVATGLALEDSDADITIQKLYSCSGEQYLLDLEDFGDALRQLPFVLECRVITTARVPVIKLVVDLAALGVKFSKSVLKADITLDDETNGPLVSYGVIFTNWVIKKLQLVPLLKPIVVLLKRLLYASHLNIPYYGGLSSYTLILMLSALLHTCPLLPSVAHYFLEALRYYGEKFQSERMVVVQGEYISIVAPGMVPQDELVVADLFCPGVNAAANVTRFKDIRTMFNTTFHKIYDSAAQPSILKAVIAKPDA